MGEWEGGHFWADEMAQLIGTIPYEVLTSIKSKNTQSTCMKVATFNVNGIRARLDSISELMQMEAPDVLCLQEIKCENDLFPYDFFKDYQCYVNGQKAYNGVSICSRKEGVPVGVLEEVEKSNVGSSF